MTTRTPEEDGAPAVEPTIAIAATFTVEPLADVLEFWRRTLEMPARIAFAPYNQVFQQLLDSTSVMARNRTGLNVVLLRWEDLGNREAVRDRTARDVARALRTAAGFTTTPCLVIVCPAAKHAAAAHREEFDRLEAQLVSSVADLQGVDVLLPADLQALYPVSEYDDPAAFALGHVPYTPVFFAALGTIVMRRFHARQRPPFKVIALDCDETLWKGVCGEVGPHGIKLDAPHRFLQKLMVAQQQAGMLLALCSRNNDEDVDAVFEQRADMPLKREHLVARRTNWRPKAENLMSLARELRLDLDSFIFIDDDRVACAEVEAICPEVLTIQLPKSSAIPKYLSHVWALDVAGCSREDARRTELYRQDLARERLRRESLNLEEFFATLKLDIQVRAMAALHLGRVAQLTRRTNQFNCTTIRRSEEELTRIYDRRQLEGLVIEVSDRFGSYGLVGAVLFRRADAALVVETFLLSCRALGRGVEHRMLSALGELALERGLDRVELMFRASGKNTPALEFLTSLANADRRTGGQDEVFTLSSADAARVRFTPGAHVSGLGVPEAGDGNRWRRAALRPAPSGLARRIATELADAESIRRAIDLGKRHARPDLKTGYAEPRTTVEMMIANLWAQALGVDRVGIHDNFFALGGHSLLATLLVSRMRDAFGEDISLETFFERPTVAAMADWMERRRIQQAGPGELSEILRALERLSDEEVEGLLARETRGANGPTDGSTPEEVPS